MYTVATICVSERGKLSYHSIVMFRLCSSERRKLYHTNSIIMF